MSSELSSQNNVPQLRMCAHLIHSYLYFIYVLCLAFINTSISQIVRRRTVVRHVVAPRIIISTTKPVSNEITRYISTCLFNTQWNMWLDYTRTDNKHFSTTNNKTFNVFNRLGIHSLSFTQFIEKKKSIMF